MSNGDVRTTAESQQETIASGFWRQARKNADACAIRVEQTRVTYGELLKRNIQVATWIRAQKLGGQRIGIKLENGASFIACFYGAVLAGSIAVPLPADLPNDQLVDWREHLDLSVVLEAEPGLLSQATSCNEQENQPELDPEQLFYMAVSSGSTGMPKGILRTHRSWVESFYRMKEAFGTGGQDMILLPGPLHYSATLIAALQVLHEGGEVVLMTRFHSHAVLEHLQSGGVTACFMVPAMYAKLLAMIEQGRGTEPFTDENITFISAGDKLSFELANKWLQAFPGSSLYEYYGAAEISFVSYIRHGQNSGEAGSVGRPFPGVEVTIRDEQGQLLKTGEIGGVHVKSSMVAQSYGHAQAPPFIQPTVGGYTVGDLGYLDEAGCLHLVGRKQNVIVRGGVNLYPAEIERALVADEAISEAAVFGVPDQVLGERIIAAVILANRQDADGEDPENTRLAAVLQHRFARARRPDEYWIVPQLPRNAAGKTDKRKLRDLFFEQKGRRENER
ncbi:long-chain fatty acid--CoA ligase [Brevibacillus fluminis]|uniref:Long-chain fatty acid--CoA ligase n=1 Tax=Brevibacillus fluminis TaxID=511487 RepID=A0A3M8DVV0_9BACL|nr:class I adenylate-forming enzyme family protein [Brevibacillus fluminis]RNB92298.1 long-chain fatty acid--CoA ligase [Brevibacillus fluminis]